MRDWGLILGGLIVWTLHFLLIYGFASVADISEPETRRLWSIAGLAGSALGLAALAWIGYRAKDASPLVRRLGTGGSIVAAVAVVWQSLPLLIAA